MLYNIISGLRLDVTGLMNNADNLITIRSVSCFVPKLIFFSSMENILIQLLCQALYSLKSPISVPNVLFRFRHGKPQSWIQFLWKQNGMSRLTPLMQLEILGANSLSETWRYFHFALFFPFVGEERCVTGQKRLQGRLRVHMRTPSHLTSMQPHPHYTRPRWGRPVSWKLYKQTKLEIQYNFGNSHSKAKRKPVQVWGGSSHRGWLNIQFAMLLHDSYWFLSTSVYSNVQI